MSVMKSFRQRSGNKNWGLPAIIVQSATARYTPPQNPAGLLQIMQAVNVTDDQVGGCDRKTKEKYLVRRDFSRKRLVEIRRYTYFQIFPGNLSWRFFRGVSLGNRSVDASLGVFLCPRCRYFQLRNPSP